MKKLPEDLFTETLAYEWRAHAGVWTGAAAAVMLVAALFGLFSEGGGTLTALLSYLLPAAAFILVLAALGIALIAFTLFRAFPKSAPLRRRIFLTLAAPVAGAVALIAIRVLFLS